MDFIDEVLDGMNILLTERFINDGVVGKRNSLFFNFSISPLENQFSDGLSRRISESDVGLDFTEEVGGCFVYPDEYTVVELS
jgi:hypothetical protein